MTLTNQPHTQDRFLLKGRNVVAPMEWSSDGGYVTYFGTGRGGLSDLFLLKMTRDESPVVTYLATKFQEVGNRLSPDGKLMAYNSDESGRQEVYVQRFPITEQKWLVSLAGGLAPQWRRDGRELFYMTLDRKLIAVDVTTVPEFVAGAPRVLFQTHGRGGYAVSRDGQRFLINSLVGGGTSTIVVVLNGTGTIPR